MACLKKELEYHIVPSIVLPPLDDEGKLVLLPKAIIHFREKNLRWLTIKEYLVKRKDPPVEDATWMNEEILQHPDLKLLEDKQFQGGWIVMSPPS